MASRVQLAPRRSSRCCPPPTVAPGSAGPNGLAQMLSSRDHRKWSRGLSVSPLPPPNRSSLRPERLSSMHKGRVLIRVSEVNVSGYKRRLPLEDLPYRKGTLAKEHGEGLDCGRSFQISGAPHGAPHDTSRIQRIGQGRSGVQREHHAGAIRSQRIRESDDASPQAVPSHAGFRALGIDPTSRSRIVAAQDPCGLVEGLDLQHTTAQRTGSACPVHEGRWRRPCGHVRLAVANIWLGRDGAALAAQRPTPLKSRA